MSVLLPRAICRVLATAPAAVLCPCAALWRFQRPVPLTAGFSVQRTGRFRVVLNDTALRVALKFRMGDEPRTALSADVLDCQVSVAAAPTRPSGRCLWCWMGGSGVGDGVGDGHVESEQGASEASVRRGAGGWVGGRGAGGPENCRGGGGAPAKGRGVGEMGMRVGPSVLCNNGCWRRNTNPKRFFPPKEFPPQMCSQNDQRDVGIILSHKNVGVDPPPPGHGR